MANNWYIIHIYSGYENKVQSYIENNIRKNGILANIVGEIKVPVEDVTEMKNGKKRNIKKKFFPGYILIEMDLPDVPEEWKRITNFVVKIPGVTGFLGTTAKNQKPKPISNEDVKNILMKMGEIKSEVIVPKISYAPGDHVKINEGPFANFNGVIEDINHEKGKVKLKVEIFGRSTPIELDFMKIEKLS